LAPRATDAHRIQGFVQGVRHFLKPRSGHLVYRLADSPARFRVRCAYGLPWQPWHCRLIPCATSRHSGICCHPSADHSSESGAGACALHATTPRFDQYNSMAMARFPNASSL
jgi:hypothetical protein